jgi:hypothetical protein
MTDNAWAYRLPIAPSVRRAGRPPGVHQTALQLAERKVERLNRTLQTEWAYRQVFTSNTEQTAALAPGSTTTTLNDAIAHT